MKLNLSILLSAVLFSTAYTHNGRRPGRRPTAPPPDAGTNEPETRSPSEALGESDDVHYIYTGCFNTEISWYPDDAKNTPGEGIQAYSVDSSGNMTPVDEAYDGIVDPIWLTTTPDGRFMYASGGADPGNPQAFELHGNGSISFLSEVDALAPGMTHTSVYADGSILLAAHYGGQVTTYDIDSETGELLSSRQSIDYSEEEVEGTNVDRQDAPHPHGIVPHGDYIYVPDLGADLIRIMTFDHDELLLEDDVDNAVGTPAGSGPRHIVFHPTLSVAYVTLELTSEIGVYSVDESTGQLADEVVISSLPSDADTDGQTNAAVYVHPSGDYVLVSNRGAHSSIGVFSVDEEDGSLEWVSDFVDEEGGLTIRDFAILPNDLVIVGYQDTNEIQSLTFDPSTGELSTIDDVDRQFIGSVVRITT